MSDWLKRTHNQIYSTVNLTVTFFGNEGNRIRLGLQSTEEHPSMGERTPAPEVLTAFGLWYFDVFLPGANAYKVAYKGWEDYSKRAPADQVRLDDAELVVKQELRHLHNIVKVFPATTNNDLLAMGFPVRHEPTHTPAPIADSYPVPTVVSDLPGVVVVSYVDSKTGRKGKPAGGHGALMLYGVLNDDPMHWDQLTHRIFSTTSPITLHFDLSMRGRTIYIALCWENTTGQHGDFGPIVSAIIG